VREDSKGSTCLNAIEHQAIVEDLGPIELIVCREGSMLVELNGDYWQTNPSGLGPCLLKTRDTLTAVPRLADACCQGERGEWLNPDFDIDDHTQDGLIERGQPLLSWPSFLLCR
jgi:hypothetical protein